MNFRSGVKEGIHRKEHCLDHQKRNGTRVIRGYHKKEELAGIVDEVDNGWMKGTRFIPGFLVEGTRL